MELVYGATQIDRLVPDVERLLDLWHETEHDWGDLYLEYMPATAPNRLLLEDLAVTMLINSRVAGQAAASFSRYGHTIELAQLPAKALEDTTADDRELIANVIGTMTSWPWVGASLATKTLHKKCPQLIPVLDNQAIFGAYMNPLWPEERSLAETIKAVPRIKLGLDWIHLDLTRPENQATWSALHLLEPKRSRIDLFDMVWWMYFREKEPMIRSRSSASRSPEPLE